MSQLDDRTEVRQPAVQLRDEVRPEDRVTVRKLVESTGFFSAAETDVAVELVDERLVKGTASGYFFVFAEWDRQTVGYACYGPIACTVASFDLYWIVVANDFRGRGVGRILLHEAERLIRESGGRRVYAETSGREQYASTRAFYERCRYVRDATLKDFYAPADDKVIYLKVV